MTKQRNEHTGDLLQTKASTEEYRSNYDRIFRREHDTVDTSNHTGIRNESTGEKV